MGRASRCSCCMTTRSANTPMVQPMDCRRIRVRRHTPLKYLLADTNTSFATVEVITSESEANSYEVMVQPGAHAPVGEHQFEVSLHSETPDGDVLPVARVPVVMRVSADVQATPGELNFAACRIGGSPFETVVVQSRAGAPFELNWGVSDGSGISVDEVLNEGSYKAVRVCQDVNAEGEHSGTIEFFVRREGRPDLRIPVAVRYLGIAE